MAEAAFRASVGASSTTATVVCNHNKQNIQWIVWQISCESSRGTLSLGQVDSIRRNGRYLTSSFILPAAAQGPPAITLDGSDNLEVIFSQLVTGEQVVVTLFYQEIQVGHIPPAYGIV